MQQFPSSRYMGSKQSILPFLEKVFSQLCFNTALDAFSGSGAVGYLLKSMDKAVTCNDFLTFAYHTSNASIANSSVHLSESEMEKLLLPHINPNKFVEETFKDLYFTCSENRFLDNLSANIFELESETKRSIALASLARACLRRRPRGSLLRWQR